MFYVWRSWEVGTRIRKCAPRHPVAAGFARVLFPDFLGDSKHQSETQAYKKTIYGKLQSGCDTMKALKWVLISHWWNGSLLCDIHKSSWRNYSVTNDWEKKKHKLVSQNYNDGSSHNYTSSHTNRWTSSSLTFIFLIQSYVFSSQYMANRLPKPTPSSVSRPTREGWIKTTQLLTLVSYKLSSPTPSSCRQLILECSRPFWWVLVI